MLSLVIALPVFAQESAVTDVESEFETRDSRPETRDPRLETQDTYADTDTESSSTTTLGTAADTVPIETPIHLPGDLRPLRLKVALTAVEATSHLIAIGLFAACDADLSSNVGDDTLTTNFCVGNGIRSAAISALNFYALVKSVRELRKRSSGKHDPFDLQWPRLAIAVSAINASNNVAWLSSGIAAVVSDGKEKASGVVGSSVLLGLHIWSLVRNVKEFRMRQRMHTERSFAQLKKPRVSISPAGVLRW